MSNVLNGFDPPKGSGDDNAIFVEGSLVPQRIEYSIAPGASNTCEVTITVQDGHGGAIMSPMLISIWASDSSAGIGVSANAGLTFGVKASEGILFDIYNSGPTASAGLFQTKDDGVCTVTLSDFAKSGYYLGVQLPVTGITVVSRQLVTGDYG